MLCTCAGVGEGARVGVELEAGVADVSGDGVAVGMALGVGLCGATVGVELGVSVGEAVAGVVSDGVVVAIGVADPAAVGVAVGVGCGIGLESEFCASGSAWSVKSRLFASVSCPDPAAPPGRRSIEWPDATAAAGIPSSHVLVALPQPTESTAVAAPRMRIATLPPVDANPPV
jgi:hypothetical protein